MPSRRQVLATLAASATAGIAGCSSKAGSSNNKSTSNSVESVTYLTGLANTPREQYARVADAKGFFTDANIKVTVRPGQPSNVNLQSLAAGQAQFASIDFVSTIVNAAAFPNFRIIAAIQDRTLLGLITRKSANINQPADLIGKTLGDSGAKAAGRTLFEPYAKLAHLDTTKVKWQDSTADLLTGLFVNKKVDAMTGYIIDQPNIMAALKGEPTSALAYSDYLTDLYGTVIVTTTDLIQKKPDLVKGFANAIMKGALYSVAHTDEAGQIINKAVPLDKAEASTAVMNLMKPYVGDGSLDTARVARGIATLEGFGMGKPGLQPSDLLASADLIAKVPSL